MTTAETMRETKHPPKPLVEAFCAALEHIEKRGSLLGFAPDRALRLVLIKGMTEQKLVVWDRTAGKYELTTFGRQCLAEYRPNNRLQLTLPAIT